MTDPESQAPQARPRMRGLDWCLALSVLLLYAVLGAVATLYLLDLKTAHSTPETSAPQSQLARVVASKYSMTKVAYLRPSKVDINDNTVEWISPHYGEGNMVGSMYSFSETTHVLEVKHQSSYLLMLNLTARCVNDCPEGNVTMVFRDQDRELLRCTVNLPQHKGSVVRSQSCIAITPLRGGRRLNAFVHSSHPYASLVVQNTQFTVVCLEG